MKLLKLRVSKDARNFLKRWRNPGSVHLFLTIAQILLGPPSGVPILLVSSLSPQTGICSGHKPIVILRYWRSLYDADDVPALLHMRPYPWIGGTLHTCL